MTTFRSGLLTSLLILALSLSAAASPVLVERQSASPIYGCGSSGCPAGSCEVELAPSSSSSDTCTTYSSSFVFPPSYQQATGQWNVFWNIPADVVAGDCQVLIRNPEQNDESLCGVLSLDIHSATCVLDSLGSEFIVQYCCGEDCASLSASAVPEIGTESLSSIKESFNGEAFLINLEPRKTSSRLKGRSDDSCHSYEVGRGPYTETPAGTAVTVESGVSCAGTVTSCTSSYSFSNEFSWTISITIGASEIALVQESISLENSQTQQYQTQFTIPPGASGNIIFAPTYTCQDVFLTNCDDPADSKWVTGCTPELNDDGTVKGTYSLLQIIE